MSKIGLYVYQLVVSRTDNYQKVPYASSGIGSELYSFLPNWVSKKLTTLQNDHIERSWRLAAQPDTGRSKHGIVHYGTYGYSSTIVDPTDNQVLFDRSSGDVEEIPLYYQFWVPDGGNFAFAALQSFRERSCVTQVLGELTSDFNHVYDHLRLTVRKIMPANDAAYKNAPVKKLLLSTKKVSKDRAEILRNLPPDELNVELSFSVRRNGAFGRFVDVAPKIRAAEGGTAFVFDGIEFNEASALVQIGNSYMKVGIIGPANTAGVIDITDEVKFGVDQHPTFASVAATATRVIADFRTQYGMK